MRQLDTGARNITGGWGYLPQQILTNVSRRASRLSDISYYSPSLSLRQRAQHIVNRFQRPSRKATAEEPPLYEQYT